MAPIFPLHLLRGPFNFLRPAADEVEALFPDVNRTLPWPRPIFLEDEESTPIHGFAVLLSPEVEALRAALEEHLEVEESVQVAVLGRRPSDRQLLAQSWERYRKLLMRAVENVTLSSYGRNFPAVFWLYHSLDLARFLKETPRRVLRLDLEIGRRHGDAVRYRVLERYLDRVFSDAYDVVTRLAEDTEEVEESLFPRLLTRLKDNVLLLTEDHVGHDLAELAGYFSGYLGLDGRDFRQRLAELDGWHRERLAEDAEMRAAVQHLIPANAVGEGDPAREPRRLLMRRGYVRYLSLRRDYQAARRERGLFDPRQVEVWEGLLDKLKEFELVHALRRMVVPATLEARPGGDKLVHRGSAARALGRRELVLSQATRPMDFMASWVVDPQVARFGLIYDITDFSEIVTMLRRMGSGEQDDSFRQMFRLQRRIHRVAEARRLRLEKYLGDGAFYSARLASGLLATAVHVQRIYRQALKEGLPFDRGVRLALNFSQYRLIPIAVARPGEAERYEFFGHGVIELSRLTTGKALREIEDLKNMLVTLGYPEATVQRFFSPLLHRDVDLVEKEEESRPFYAYINRNGHLVNEGIVATEPFVRALAEEVSGVSLGVARLGDRSYVVLEVSDPGASGPLRVGVRNLGRANLKGLEKMPVYEVVDGAAWDADDVEPVTTVELMEAIDRAMAGTLVSDEAGTRPAFREGGG
jgi:hypothetical protein